MATSSAVVNPATGDNLSNNNSLPPRLPPPATETQRRMPVAIKSIVLTEDIPGAMLNEPFNKHTIPELRWWLLRKRVTVQTSLKKAEIIQR